jgi:hypothetical protein
VRWLLVFALTATASAAQLDIATYTPIDGWKLTTGGDGVAFAKVVGGSSCLISLQKARDAVASDFAGELEPTWKAALGALGVGAVGLPSKTFAGKSSHDIAMITTAAATTLGDKSVLVQVAILDAGAKIVPVIVLASNAETLKNICAPSLDALINSITVKATPRK